MTNKEAAEKLQLTEPFDEDDVQDAYEESFFTIRDYFLKNTVVPQLFVGRLQRLKKFEEAFCRLSNQTMNWIEPELEPLPDSNMAGQILGAEINSLSILLESYEKEITQKRILIAQSWTIPEVVKNTLALVQAQQAYQVLFEDLAQIGLDSATDLKIEVKAAEQVDSGLLLMKLKKRSESTKAESEFQELLAREFARIQKINRLLQKV